jgi:hypothetical protein
MFNGNDIAQAMSGFVYCALIVFGICILFSCGAGIIVGLFIN